MAADLRIKRGALGSIPTAAAGEPLFATDQFKFYIGSAGGNRLMGVLDNDAGTVAPSVNDDAGDGYSVNSSWVDVVAGNTYVCVDSTIGAAIWKQTDGGGGGGTVTSVDLTMPTGFSVSGNPVTTSGTLAVTITGDVDFAGFKLTSVADPTNPQDAATMAYVDAEIAALPAGGTVTSVDLTMPTGFSISGNPITTAGTLAVTITGNVDFASQRLISVADPLNPQDAATMAYVGATAQPLDATLTALAALDWVADGIHIGSGADTCNQITFGANKFPAHASSGGLAAKDITDYALSLLDDAAASNARTTLGATTVGANLFTVTDPSAVRFIRIDAANTVTLRTAAQMLSDIGGGSGTGTVTSFSAGDLSPLFTTSEATPTTTPALTFTLSTQSANLGFFGPTSGGAAGPTFRAQVVADLPALNGFTDADPAFADVLPGYDATATANRDFRVDYLLGLQPATPGGRLTLSTGNPVSVNITAISTVYYCPYLHNRITLWDGTRWVTVSFAEVSVAIGTVTSLLPHDVFGYLSGGALAIEKLAWSVGTGRATGISLQDGRYCKTGDKTRLYLGTFAAVNTTQSEFTVLNRLVWNMYNRVWCNFLVHDSTDSWVYNTTTIRPMNNSTLNRVGFVRGLDEDILTLQHVIMLNAPNNAGSVGYGLDNTTTNNADRYGTLSIANSFTNMMAEYCNRPGIGYHYLQCLEMGTGSATNTWYGDAGAPTQYRYGTTGGGWF